MIKFKNFTTILNLSFLFISFIFVNRSSAGEYVVWIEESVINNLIRSTYLKHTKYLGVDYFESKTNDDVFLISSDRKIFEAKHLDSSEFELRRYEGGYDYGLTFKFRDDVRAQLLFNFEIYKFGEILPGNGLQLKGWLPSDPLSMPSIQEYVAFFHSGERVSSITTDFDELGTVTTKISENDIKEADFEINDLHFTITCKYVKEHNLELSKAIFKTLTFKWAEDEKVPPTLKQISYNPNT